MSDLCQRSSGRDRYEEERANCNTWREDRTIREGMEERRKIGWEGGGKEGGKEEGKEREEGNASRG